MTTTGMETTCSIDLAQLMRAHKITIRQLAAKMGVTIKRVREVRAMTRLSYLSYCDYYEAVTGQVIFSKARWDAICAQRAAIMFERTGSTNPLD